MNIDTLNAYCRFVLVTNLPLGQVGYTTSIKAFFTICLALFRRRVHSGVGPSCTLQCSGLLSTLGILSRVVRGCASCSRVQVCGELAVNHPLASPIRIFFDLPSREIPRRI